MATRSMSEAKRHTVKLWLLGKETSGKTALMNSFMGKEFSEEYISSIGTSQNSTYKDTIINEKNVRIHLRSLMTRGENELRELQIESPEIMGAIVVIDLTKPLDSKWLEETMQTLKQDSKQLEKKMLIGNKLDLETERQIFDDQLKELKEQFGFDLCFTTSAINKDGVNVLFEGLATKIFTNKECFIKKIESTVDKYVQEKSENLDIKAGQIMEVARVNQKFEKEKFDIIVKDDVTYYREPMAKNTNVFFNGTRKQYRHVKINYQGVSPQGVIAWGKLVELDVARVKDVYKIQQHLSTTSSLYEKFVALRNIANNINTSLRTSKLRTTINKALDEFCEQNPCFKIEAQPTNYVVYGKVGRT